MYFSDRITLRKETITKDNDGYSSATYQDVEVWANKKSVARSEFYSANANGINAVIAFDVHTEDYNGQKHILYNSKSYEVIRSYQKGEGIVELNCSDKAV